MVGAERKKGWITGYGLVIVPVVIMIAGLPGVYGRLLPEGKTASHEYYALEGFIEGTEYLPADAKEDEVNHELLRSSENISVLNYEKRYTNIRMECENGGTEEGYIDVPLFYYPCYKAVDAGTKEALSLTYGENERIRILLPPGYQGTIELKVSERKVWRFAEIISIFSISFAAYMAVAKKKGVNRKVNR